MSSGFEIAGVSSLQKPNARIVAQAKIHLPIPGIDGNHLGRAVLQHAIAEAPGGSANVKTNLAMKVNSPVLESLLQLEPAPADIAEIFAQQAQNRS